MNRFPLFSVFILATLACTSGGIALSTPTAEPLNRLATIPADIPKIIPAGDAWPPIIASEWSQPQPLGAPINTAGGEDSPFMSTDGQHLYFFFTPDVRKPAQEQLFDGVTGIWVTENTANGWSEPKRLSLDTGDELHLDGCPFVLGNWMLFCTIRESTAGEIRWFSAIVDGNRWSDLQDWNQQINSDGNVGELHISADGQVIYFGSDRPDGHGGFDIWMSVKAGNGWGEPVNLGPGINSAGDENRPFLTADGSELWFDSTTRTGEYYPGPAVFRTRRQSDGSWGAAEEIVSQFAAEPALSSDGNTLYFVHHYYDAELQQMLEADIYISNKKVP